MSFISIKKLFRSVDIQIFLIFFIFSNFVYLSSQNES